MTVADIKTRMSRFKPLGEIADDSPALPGFLYNDPDVLAVEKQQIFYTSWQLIAHKTELPNPGDYICANIVDEPVFIMRQRDGSLRAFYNVCQHRAHQILTGSGTVRGRMICPYHAWAYSLDGEFIAGRGIKNMPNFDLSAYRLEPVALEERCGFLFVNLDDNPIPIDEVAGDMFADIRREVPWLDDLTVSTDSVRHSWDVEPLPANWKVLAENCLECYHCAPAHPAFSDLVNLKSYACTPHGKWLKSKGPLKKWDNKAYQVDESEPVTEATFWHMFPNNQFGVLPGERALAAFRFFPETPDTTRMSARLLTMPDETVAPERLNYRWNILWPEDEALCRSVHQGLKSRGYRQGRFVVDPQDLGIGEHGVHYFQTLYSDAMGL